MPTMKVRHQRGTFVDSMATQVEIERSCEALADFFSGFKPAPTPESIAVEYYCYEDRLKQDCYLVTTNGHGLGFTDGPLP